MSDIREGIIRSIKSWHDIREGIIHYSFDLSPNMIFVKVSFVRLSPNMIFVKVCVV